MAYITIIISCLALGVSSLTLWLTYLKHGTIKMTPPTTIFFGNDKGDNKSPKVYLRTLLYSTSKKGQIIQSLYVKLKRGESVQNFNIWVYGAKNDLVRGSGLFVGPEGVTYNHHFLLPKDGTDYSFLPGKYILQVHCTIIGKKQQRVLNQTELMLTESESKELSDIYKGIYFDWGPDSEKYHSFVEEFPGKINANSLMN